MLIFEIIGEKWQNRGTFKFKNEKINIHRVLEGGVQIPLSPPVGRPK